MDDALYYVLFALSGKNIESEPLELPEFLYGLIFPQGDKTRLEPEFGMLRRLRDPYRDHYYPPEDVPALAKQLEKLSQKGPDELSSALVPLREKCGVATSRNYGLLFAGN
jgi:hypothetical protein